MNWRAIIQRKPPSQYDGAFARVRLVRAWIAVFYALVGLAYCFAKFIEVALL